MLSTRTPGLASLPASLPRCTTYPHLLIFLPVAPLESTEHL